MTDFILRSILIGGFATLVLDVWNVILNRSAGFALPNWGYVGRWVIHALQGSPYQPDIANSRVYPNERAIGWAFHYAVGIAFAAALLAIWPGWAKNPTFWPPMIVGWVTIGCGWFILAPCLGAGMAHSSRPDPMTPRLLNIAGHTVFGLALWIAGLALKGM
ncbi:MAG: DUF2938 family protein [Albidovulum sp.]